MTRVMILMIALAAGLAPVAEAAKFKVVVHPDNATLSMSRADVSALFLKKTVRWPDGSPVAAVDQTDTSTVRADFCAAVHKKHAAAIRSYWQQQIFSGRDTPPLSKSNDAQVLEYVRTHRGAVGYVSDSATTAGVKVVEVN